MELMRKNFEREKDSKENVKAEMSKVEDQEEDLKETVSKYQVVTDVMKEQKGVQSLELEERFEMEPARVELQHTEDIGHPRQQLNQEGEELRTQCRNRGSLRYGGVLFLGLSRRQRVNTSPACTRMDQGDFL